jgi:hypothetical protein
LVGQLNEVGTDGLLNGLDLTAVGDGAAVGVAGT